MGTGKLDILKMLRRAYILLLVDSVSAVLIAFMIPFILPKPLDLVVTMLVSFLIIARSISYILKVARACSISRMYIDDGDDDE